MEVFFLEGGEGEKCLECTILQNLTRWLCPVTSPTSEAWYVKPICTLVALVQLGNQPGGLLKRVGFHLVSIEP